MTTSFMLNGGAVALQTDDPTESLLRWLKRQRLAGTKEGCADGDCGACTVAMAHTAADGSTRWQAVNSCLLPMGSVVGREILTVEALADGESLHPVQQAMVDCAGSQCGYCTPGFVMSLFVAQGNGVSGDDAIEGNLCRCTGYRPIRDAAALLAEDPTSTQRLRPIGDASSITSNDLGAYFNPDSVDAALLLKRRYPDAAWIAGATDLGVELSRATAKATSFIALDRIAALQEITIDEDVVRIGAGVSLTRIEHELIGVFPAIDQMLPWFAARQVRNRATLGGNLGSASPIGDLLPVLLALDAHVLLAGPQGTRRLPVDGYFIDYRKTQRAPDELIVALELPRVADLINASYKVAKRQTDDISIVAAAFALGVDAQQAITHARLAYGGVAAIPRRAHAIETSLVGRTLDATTIDTVAEKLEAEFTPLSDHRASADYRRALCSALWRKFAATLLSDTHREHTAHTSARALPNPQSPIPNPGLLHESARGHTTGRATYTDEQHPPVGLASIWPVQAPHAHARILDIDADAARAQPGVLAVLTAHDVPGENDTGPILHDEPLIPAGTVEFFGQAVAWVVAETEAQAQAAAHHVRVSYETLPACTTLAQAIAEQRFHLPPSNLARGDADAALATAAHRLQGEFDVGGQDHFYLETQASWVQIDGEGIVHVSASTQHPTETQIIVARVLGIPAHRVVCRCLRMGGGFGGKETQANPYAAIAALAAHVTHRPVRIKLPRQQDMQLTGKRHPFHAHYDVGFDDDGRLLGLRATLTADGGWSCDLSPPVLMRAMVHIDNAYFIPDVAITGRIGKTHLASNTAFRGFGGPQGMVVGEEVLDRVARHLGLPAHVVRERNFYRAAQTPDCNTTPYHQTVVDNHIDALWQQLKRDSDFEARRDAIAAHNAQHAHAKRGIAITPVKFGISFNKTEYNQAGALLHVYLDGSIQLNHGGTEMGQGLHTKLLVVASRVLGVSIARIKLMTTATDKVPNTSATAASSGSDLNGQAVKAACETLLARLRPVAAQMLGGDPGDVRFADDTVFLAATDATRLRFEDVVALAYRLRISLSATGYYRTPDIHWDPATGRGHPFYYFAYGAAVSEVEVCGYTGVQKLLRVDLLHDVGESLAEGIDRGQIEGGFVQGLGWLTCEELRWNDQGKLLTDAPSTYKIPTNGEVPHDFRVSMFRRSDPPSTDVIFGSKGVGEPPLMLAISVREAIREAVAAFAPSDAPARRVDLAAPATPEAIHRAITQVRNTAGVRLAEPVAS